MQCSRIVFPSLGLVLGIALIGGMACSSSEASNADPNALEPEGNRRLDDGGAPTGQDGDRGDGGGSAGKAQEIHLLGRFDTRDPKGPRASWPGSQIRTRFSGTGATLRIQVTKESYGPDQLDISIDGAPATVLKPTEDKDSYEIAAGLADGEHDVVITKRTEPVVGSFQFLGIESTEKRPLVPTAPPFSRWIEFIGDSITCGFGVLAPNTNCQFSATTESEPAAYGALTANALSAGHTAIAFSGIGMYRNSGGSTDAQMPVRFFRTLANDPTSEWDFHITPDVVVINLGTNDFTNATPKAEYEKAYGEFLVKLRAKYAQAFFVATVSSMMTDTGGIFPKGIKNRAAVKASVAKIVADRVAAGETKLSVLEFEEQAESDGYGCGYHPSQATQKRDAAKLTAHLKTLTGW